MTRKNVVLLDYGAGNLRSAQRALEHAGAEVTVTADPKVAVEADGLVVRHGTRKPHAQQSSCRVGETGG